MTTAWNVITGVIKRPVVVTNNIFARDAFGQMSHLWVTSFVQHNEDTGFFCFDGHRRVIGLTHYVEIDPPAAMETIR